QGVTSGWVGGWALLAGGAGGLGRLPRWGEGRGEGNAPAWRRIFDCRGRGGRHGVPRARPVSGGCSRGATLLSGGQLTRPHSVVTHPLTRPHSVVTQPLTRQPSGRAAGRGRRTWRSA